MDLFLHYLKAALRAILKKRVNALFNISSLSLGIACAAAIYLFVQQQLSFDSFHSEGPRIYRIANEIRSSRGNTLYAVTTARIGPLMKETSSLVETYVRVARTGERAVSYEGRKLKKTMLAVDPQFFDVFSFPLYRGDSGTALTRPGSAVISRSLAEALFGGTDPLGKRIRVNGSHDLTVTGVSREVPFNSSLRFDLLTSIDYLATMYGEDDVRTGSYTCMVFLLAAPDAGPEPLTAALDGCVNSHFTERYKTRNRLFLQPLSRIHLTTGYLLDAMKTSDPRYIYYFSIVGVIMMIIAGVNFTNFMMTGSFGRAREIGIRKTAGANRAAIMKQFFTESFLIITVSLLAGLLLVYSLLPRINRFFDLHLIFPALSDWSFVLFVLLLITGFGVVAGGYPALILSAFHPAAVIRRQAVAGTSRFMLKKILIVIQFSVTLVFIIYTLVISRQMIYLENKDLNYNRDNLVYFHLGDAGERKEILRERLLEHPDIIEAAAAEFSLGREINISVPFTMTRNGDTQQFTIPVIHVTPGFFSALEVPVIAGRDFSRERTADAGNTVILNASAARMLGIEPPTTERLFNTWFERDLSIIGLVPDFHVESLYAELRPYIFYYAPELCHEMVVRIRPGSGTRVLEYIQRTWESFAPEGVFTAQLVSEKILTAYREEKKTGAIFRYAAAIAIIIASLGLVGLMILSAKKRTREISIRRTLGATIPRLLLLLIKEYSLLLLVAMAAALPLARYIAGAWLQGFAYRTDLSPLLFLQGVAIVLGIELTIVTMIAWRAATARPADALRYE
ncbi:ABC transporter permease [bacterium]|nr:ABC transporter permease [bacterium]